MARRTEDTAELVLKFSQPCGSEALSDGWQSSREQSMVGLLTLVFMPALKPVEGQAKHENTAWLTVSDQEMSSAVVVVLLTPHESSTVAMPI